MSRLTALPRRLRRPTETRESAVQIAKAVIAGTASWWIAGPQLGLAAAAFAPLAALLVVGLTIQRSVWQSARHLVAVLIGAVLAVLIGLGTDVRVWAVALVLVSGLLVTRWRWLDDQRFQVPVIALFAFAVAAPTDSVLPYTGGLFASVLLGVAAGLVVNVVLAPPLYQQSAADAVQALATEVRDQLRSLAGELRENWPGDTNIQPLMDAVSRLQEQIRRTREAIRYSEESLRFNPRRPRGDSRPQTPAERRTAAIGLSRAAEQVIGIARTLLDTADENSSTPPPGTEFVHSYADLLDRLAETTERYAASDSDAHRRALQDHLGESQAQHGRLAEGVGSQLPVGSDTWPVYGALLVDVQRLLDELSQHVRSSLPAQPGPPRIWR